MNRPTANSWRWIRLIACLSGISLETAINCTATAWADVDEARLDSKPIDFARDVQPILNRACLRCHGPAKQKGEYRLDVRDVALKRGESYAPNIIPGKSNDSPLVKFVSGNGDLKMPPEGPRLSDAEIAIIKRWIDEGAAWPDDVAGKLTDKADLWSLRPLSLSALHPKLDVERPTIDDFIQAKLITFGLKPSAMADRRRLIRRIYFDLIGLPPSPEETEAFISDNAPNAYERLVDRLLESPRYGERWARHWLDAAHFAETHGHDQDRIRENAWPYRDYLIQSLNSDKPYARFVLEQVAGDVLFPDDPQATVALGFLAAGPWDESSLRDIREDTIDRQIARYLDRDDMIANVINNISSLTVQCARCHDHKFDPISQGDYYSLQAVFSGVERANRTFDPDPAIATRRNALLARRDQLQRKSAETVTELLSASIQLNVANWERTLGSQGKIWTPIDPETFVSSDGATLSKQSDGSILSGGTRPEKDTVTIVAKAPLSRITAIKLEVLADDSLPLRGPGRQDNGNLHLSEFELFLDGTESPLPLVNPQADFNQQDWGIARAIDNVESTAWGIYPKVGQSHAAVFEVRDPLVLPESAKLRIVLKQRHGGGHLIGRARLSVSDAIPPVGIDLLPDSISTVLAISPELRTEQQRVELALFQQSTVLERDISALPKPSRVYAAAANFEPEGGLRPPPGPRPIRVLHRGDITQPRDSAGPGALSCIAGIPSRFDIDSAAPESSRRAALARWLTDSQNPLTWRSIVNRVWHHHFGRGLVTTLNDFGHMGEAPSHPELLDWLAIEFRDGGQSLKKLHRLIVTSAAYRRAATTEPSAFNADPENRFLSHMNRTRLDAESVRDAVLQISGRLDLRMGGPSDRQFDLQPGIHVTPKVDYTKFNLDSDLGRRRSIYRFLFRTLPDPFMETLDCPSGDQITPTRSNSVTVQQALALWNDVFMARHCEHIAARIEADVSEGRKTNDKETELRTQISRAFNLILCRPVTSAELTDMTAYAKKHGMANVCRLLLNSNEFLFVN